MIQFSGITRRDLFQATESVRGALLSAGAWIVDHRQFSNVSLCIQFEMEGEDLSRLRNALAETGMDFEQSGTSRHDVTQGTVQITFVHDEPDQRIVGPLG